MKAGIQGASLNSEARGDRRWFQQKDPDLVEIFSRVADLSLMRPPPPSLTNILTSSILDQPAAILPAFDGDCQPNRNRR